MKGKGKVNNVRPSNLHSDVNQSDASRYICCNEKEDDILTAKYIFNSDLFQKKHNFRQDPENGYLSVAIMLFYVLIK